MLFRIISGHLIQMTLAIMKYGLKVENSPAACNPGNGLFAAKGLSAGTEIPAKGLFFIIYMT